MPMTLNSSRLLNNACGPTYADGILQELEGRVTAELTAAQEELRGNTAPARSRSERDVAPRYQA